MTKNHLEYLKQNDEELRKQLSGKTKYNMSYYLTPTEVFARCVELYIYFICGEKSSLVKSEYNQIYNCSDEYLKLIKDYFKCRI